MLLSSTRLVAVMEWSADTKHDMIMQRTARDLLYASQDHAKLPLFSQGLCCFISIHTHILLVQCDWFLRCRVACMRMSALRSWRLHDLC